MDTTRPNTAESRRVEQELLRLDAHTLLLVEMLRIAVARNPQELSVREKLLFASVLKLVRMGRAVDRLAKESFPEEIRAMSRTMAEVSVNAAYLCDADDKEIDRFVHFDTQSMYKHSERLASHTTSALSSEDRQKIETVVEQARLLTGRKDTDPSWSSKNILGRAEYSDGITKLDLMVKLVRTAYAYGHSAVHGTFDSLAPFIDALDDPDALASDARQENFYLALASVNFVLCTMCLYLNSLFHLGRDHEIVNAGRLTVTV